MVRSMHTVAAELGVEELLDGAMVGANGASSGISNGESTSRSMEDIPRLLIRSQGGLEQGMVGDSTLAET